MHAANEKLTSIQKKIIVEILRLHRHKRPLNISAIRQHNPKLLLDVYRIKPFWGWKQALQSAGLDYSSIKITLPEYVTCLLCNRRFSTLAKHLRYFHQISPQAYAADYKVADLCSPAYSALKTRPKNTALPHWEPNWTPEYLLDRIYELHVRGISVNPVNISKNDNACYRWAHRYFGNWNVVLRAIGVDPQTVRQRPRGRRWTRQAVLHAIKERHAKGYLINSKAIVDYDRGLASAATKLFRSYDNILRTLCLDPRKVRLTPMRLHRYKTKDDVINAICKRRLEGKPIYLTALTHGSARNGELFSKAICLFGTWKAAIEASGFNYDKIRIMPNQAPKMRRSKPPTKTAEETLEMLRRRHESGVPMTALAASKGIHADHSLRHYAIKHFGSWLKALQAAEINYAPHIPSRLRYPTMDSVIQAIKTREKTGRSLTSRGIRLGPHRDSTLYKTGLNIFGSWMAALEAAGSNCGRYAGEDHQEPRKRHLKCYADGMSQNCP